MIYDSENTALMIEQFSISTFISLDLSFYQLFGL